ncbi:hypothetical protein FCH28_16445 [Streptomyces piniterrae]|uniref:Uncharacterized protein n=1 Tax=Streptomyces piniterrae TaxID=2571125 RepID=A0A4U0NFA5_9ACTN|nr:hypothetical protein [Streptomyces piniterrae]TJZ52779.1 hypothetical protein FCH28_16445 [Streptomyces piniterrae]
MSEYASKDAAAALARARELGSTVRNGSKWSVRYQVAYGCAAAVSMLAIGLLSHPYNVAFGIGFWILALTGLSVYAARQPVARRGFTRWNNGLIMAWALLFFAVLFPGITWFRGVEAWWVPGAMLVALPGLIGGYLEARR